MEKREVVVAKQEDIHELAHRMAKEMPARSLADCPKEEGHNKDCYERGKSDGWLDALEQFNEMLISGRYKTFKELYDHYTEGQIAT